MTLDGTRGWIAALAVALVGSLAVLSACADGENDPIGPEEQGPAFSHNADNSVTVDKNLSGDGEEVCSAVNDTDQPWSGVKVDPAGEGTFEGFEITLGKGGRTLDWDEVGFNILKAVVIKAGDRTEIYYYNGDVPPASAVESDDDLHGPDEKHEISHYTLCHAPDPTAIKVTVEDEENSPVSDRRVVAVSSDHGPYRDDHSLQSAVTNDDGVAVIDDLEPGSYCVRVTALARTTTVIPPDSHETPPELASPLGTALSGSDGTVPLTREGFAEYCLDLDEGPEPPLSPGDMVTLELQPLGATTVNGTFGTENEQEMSAWMVVDVGSLLGSSTRDAWIDNLPSALRERVDDGRAKIGLFLTGDDDEGTQEFSIPSPGGNTALEGDKLPAGTGYETVSASVSDASIDGGLVSEPLWCTSATTDEPSTDGGSVEFEGPVEFGFLAEADLGAVLDPPGFGVTYLQGDGEAKLKLRAKTSKNTKRLVVDYRCGVIDGERDCEVEKLSGALGKRVDVDLGDAALEGGKFGLRWIVTGLPKDTETVLFGLSGPNDQFPNSSKDEDNDGLQDAARPGDDECRTQGSTWILGAD